MTTICIADKNRLTIRGVQHGQRYLVKKEGHGWWIEAAPRAPSGSVHAGFDGSSGRPGSGRIRL